MGIAPSSGLSGTGSIPPQSRKRQPNEVAGKNGEVVCFTRLSTEPLAKGTERGRSEGKAFRKMTNAQKMLGGRTRASIGTSNLWAAGLHSSFLPVCTSSDESV